MRKTKLVLIDGNAILHRAYHAMPPLKTKDGEPIGAVHGFVSMLLRVIQDLQPTHMAVAFDLEKPTFRHKEFEEYQAHRPEMDKDLSSQFDKVKAVIASFGVPIYEKEGFEADDVLATLARQAKVNRVVIVTGDRDILQLVTNKVKVYMPTGAGLSSAKLMNKKDVVEKMGVTPKQVVDYKALVGDPSDNYKGVSGIGPKTAEKLLAQFGDLGGVYKNLAKIDQRVREKLEKGKDSAKVSHKLAKIVSDVPIKLDLEDADDWAIDRPEVFAVFERFGFKTLPKRVEKLAKQMVAKNQGDLF